MHAVGTITLMLGILTLIIAQFYVTAMAFKVNPFKGILCFFIPGYALFIAKRNGFYGKFLSAYILGIIGMVVGGSILS